MGGVVSNGIEGGVNGGAMCCWDNALTSACGTTKKEERESETLESDPSERESE